MKKLIFILGLLITNSAFAQSTNPMCPTRPPGDSTNACSSTAFINDATSGIFSLPHNWLAPQTFTLTQDASSFMSINKRTIPTNYTGTRAGQVYQHTDTQAAGAGATFPMVMWDLVWSGNGVVNAATETSSSINWGITSSFTKTGDASMHGFTTIGQLGAYGPGGYNEAGGYVCQMTNVGSNKGFADCFEGLVTNSPDGGVTNYNTRMFSVVGRVAAYGVFTRPVAVYEASSEGTTAVPIFIVNPSGANFSYGIDLLGATFTSGNFFRAPNNTALVSRNAANNADISMAFVDASNQLRLAFGGASTIIGGATTINLNAATLPAIAENDQLHIGAPDGGEAGIMFDSFANYSQIEFRRADGTNAAKSALLNTDTIGVIEGYGYGATGYGAAARVSMQYSAAGNWTDASQPTQIAWQTTPIGSLTPAYRLFIGQDGRIGMGGNIAPGFTLDVTGNVNASAATYSNGILVDSATAPTISAGFCTTPSIAANNGTWAFTINVGTACAASSGTIGMPAATTGWVCDAHDVTTPASNVVEQTGGTTTTVVLQNYVRTTGVAGNFTPSDVIRVKCTAY